MIYRKFIEYERSCQSDDCICESRHSNLVPAESGVPLRILLEILSEELFRVRYERFQADFVDQSKTTKGTLEMSKSISFAVLCVASFAFLSGGSAMAQQSACNCAASTSVAAAPKLGVAYSPMRTGTASMGYRNTSNTVPNLRSSYSSNRTSSSHSAFKPGSLPSTAPNVLNLR